MSVPVKIYDKNLDIVADLQNAHNVSYTKRLNEVWNGSFDLPLDDDKNDLFDLLYFAELFDGDKRVGLFRVNRQIPERQEDSSVIHYECKHVLDTLNDDQIIDKVTKTGTNTAISYILGEQITTNWQLGTLDFSKNFEHEFKHQTLLRALLDVPQPWWEDYELTFNTQSYPWTLNIEQPNLTTKSTLRYGKNITSIEREVNAEKLITKLYAFGDGSGSDQVSAGPFTSNVSTYGTHVGIWEEQYFDNASDLETAAKKYLARVDTPRVEYRGRAADLYQLIDANEIKLGEYISVYDAGLGLDTKVQVVELSKQDVLGNPGELRFNLDNQPQEFPSYGSLAFRDKATEDNLASSSVGGGALASGSVGSDNLDNITMDDILAGATYDRVLKTDISAGHILLSEAQGDFGDIDGDLDQVPNGATYSRVKTTDITSGHILLSETYKTDGSTKADLDDLSDGSSYGRVDITALSAAKPLLSQAAGDLDDITDGTNYGKVAITDISSGHILLSETTGDIDDIADGLNYGKVNLTDIQSGSIVLSKVVGDIDDVSDGTSYRRAPDGWFYSTTTIDGGKIETNTIEVDQILVNSSINMSESGYNSITGADTVGDTTTWLNFGSSLITCQGGLDMAGNIYLGGVYGINSPSSISMAGDIDMMGHDIDDVGWVDGKDIGGWSENTFSDVLTSPTSSYEEVQLADGSTINAYLLTYFTTDGINYVGW